MKIYNCRECEHWKEPRCLAKNIVIARGYRVVNCYLYKEKNK